MISSVLSPVQKEVQLERIASVPRTRHIVFLITEVFSERALLLFELQSPLAMAMRRLLAAPSLFRGVRSFSSSTGGPAQLSGVQELTKPDSVAASTHGEIGEVSGIPAEHLKRKVVIYSPSRCTTQSGPASNEWKISFESVNKWENPLMGWTSTGDPYHSVGEASLHFDSKERAVEFAEKYGWQYTIREPHQAQLKPKAYADNFKWKGPVPEYD